jgi:hypothetical protein
MTKMCSPWNQTHILTYSHYAKNFICIILERRSPYQEKKGIQSDSEEKVFLILCSCFIFYCQGVMAMNPGSISGLFIQVIPIITWVKLS